MATVNKQISLGTDDCYEYTDEVLYLTSDPLYIGHNNANIYDIGLRWQTVNIPQAATITSAILSEYLTTDQGTVVANIFGIDEDNTATWSSGSRPSQRAKTTATIPANQANWGNWGVGNWITINITSVIQEIINRAGWSPNNALAITIEDNGASINYMALRAYEYSGNQHGAKLDIVYTPAGAKIPVIIKHLREQGIL